jgi:hypothetical protein
MRVLLATMLLLLLPGCMGMCGPTLDSIRHDAYFPGELTEANRTIARDALVAKGFTIGDSASYGLSAFHGDLRLVLGAQSNGTTKWEAQMDVENVEYRSTDQAQETGRQMAHTLWRSLNATLDDFSIRTNWTTFHRDEPQASIYIC